MVKNRFQLVSIFSTVALLFLLGIQVYWMVAASGLKKQIFEEKANLIVSRANEALNADQATCQKIAGCLDPSQGRADQARLGKQEAARVDSLLQYFLQLYQLDISYHYSISYKPKVAISGQNIRELQAGFSQGPLQINLELPESHQYLLSEMKPHFFVSIALIIILVYLFWQSNRALENEKKLAAATRSYFNNMAHEIKTPLTGISLAVGRLEKADILGASEKSRNYIQIIKEESEKLKVLVSKIALFHKAKEANQQAKEKVDMQEVIEEAIHGLQMQIEARNAEIQIISNVHQPIINGSFSILQILIQNLLDNAIKYGGNPPKVKIEISSGQNQLTIAISDNGPGISPDFQKQVFDPYFRISEGERHDHQGFGLGLSEALEKAQWHGGKILLTSRKDKGTTFEVILPYAG